ncbi:MAG: siderophore-interacting protein [Pseudomonadota bacterium]|uniref:siderophore-interacting protein n=1 Tax=Novosphingobium sp. MBES04 TaxID=1206458 RepID=UPI00058025B6|nr:siderophore-interacting protein [Novosphingobium sp. MBES04]MED5546831.1 siderophore-interacting protein [Pseudomonadota bacterium]GAM05304.1 siderophore-interacting protein [Novosphingobium sp. MBES04]
MAKPQPRTLTVLARQQVSPSMIRLTLGGEGLADFPHGQEGGYVKLMFPPAPGKAKPTLRTYTIRAQRAGEIDVDFALHGVENGVSGPATNWAVSTEIGSTIEVGGPGAAKPLPEGFDFYLVAGDMTAIPAISVNLEALDREAKGYAVIEIQQEDDRVEIDAPDGVEIRWVVNPEPGQQPQWLVEALRAYGWPEGRVYAWAASEFSAMRLMRTYLREEKALTPAELYISSYWKQGLDEESHKVVKREDAEATAA